MSKLVLIKDDQIHQAEVNEVLRLFETKFLEIVKNNLPTVAKKQDDFIKADEVCEMLDISKPTLSSWVKKGIIPKYTIESRVYFRRTEIIQVLEDSLT